VGTEFIRLRVPYFFGIVTPMPTPKRTIDIPTNPVARRAWVMYQLKCRGMSLSDLARLEGVNRRSTAMALIHPNAHLRPVIAKAIGLTHQVLFPEDFGPDGRYLLKTRPPVRKGNMGALSPSNVYSGNAG
jgi:lambda repressor-like predicted transcriptional regulator